MCFVQGKDAEERRVLDKVDRYFQRIHGGDCCGSEGVGHRTGTGLMASPRDTCSATGVAGAGPCDEDDDWVTV